ncbi:ADP-ribose diphosphatase [Aeromonas simiae]|uniref:ADP-ribose diphosphatase n=1 Tax=Aeromonas simiae TaxID=218936 RepID=UPI0005A69A8E|nr:ADP-ribose diphosphatase [Aeromonas simiae]MDO2949474.1 ADP-ribose diphosphatase [Aeromonas simiae]MDO2953138.1 ADP-ribose diphosphatase [Aeromonas simiae]MDO2956805.1 ADP-ribose diphosphatase [Aeromonas simiae]
MTGEIPEVTFDVKDVEVLEKRVGYDGFFKVNSYRLRHRLFAGGWCEPIVRELFERGHAVALLAYDPRRDQVVMIEQFRIGALETASSPWLLELIAGIIEPGEAPDEVARRESEEEAGVTLGRIEHAMSYLVSPGGTTERIEIFIGEVDASQANGLHGLPEEGEDIRVHVIDRQNAYALVQSGRIDNAASIIALQWLQLHHEALRSRWLGEA